MPIHTVKGFNGYLKHTAPRAGTNGRSISINNAAKNDGAALIVSLRHKSAEILRQNTRSLIFGKLSTGKKLSAADKQYLRKNDPEAYRQAVAIEAERRAYRRRLKRARTKDEVRRHNLNKTAQFVSEANAHKSSGSSTASGQLESVGMRSSAIRDEHVSFMRTREYRNLPETLHELKRKKARTAAPAVRQISVPIPRAVKSYYTNRKPRGIDIII